MSVEKKKNNSKTKTILNSKMCLASDDGGGDWFKLIYVNCAYILHIHTDIVYIYLVYTYVCYIWYIERGIQAMYLLRFRLSIGLALNNERFVALLVLLRHLEKQLICGRLFGDPWRGIV